ncbi:MAG: cupin domain-containing protein [Bacteroidia bacterium]
MNNRIDPQELQWKEGNVKNFFGKELLSLGNGAIKLVRIAPSAHYPEHIHPDKTEYAYVLEGCPHFLIGPDEFAGKPHEFFVFPSNIRHAIQNRSDSECLLLVGAVKN